MFFWPFAAVITQCTCYFRAYYARWKMLSSQGGVSQRGCPLGCGNARSGESVPDSSHTQSGLKESSGGHRRSAQAGSSQPRPSFPFIYFTFPILFYLLFSQSPRVAKRLKEHLLTLHTELSVFLRFY